MEVEPGTNTSKSVEKTKVATYQGPKKSAKTLLRQAPHHPLLLPTTQKTNRKPTIKAGVGSPERKKLT